MKKIDYEELADKLIEEYPVEENPQLYNMYTEMKQHLMKVFKLKENTAIKFMTKVLEPRLNIHLYREYELSRLSFLRFRKIDDKNKYLRILYWSKKITMDLLIEIYDKYDDISADIVNKYMRETGKLTAEQISDYYYARDYYHLHREEILEHKRAYRKKKMLKKGDLK